MISEGDCGAIGLVNMNIFCLPDSSLLDFFFSLLYFQRLNICFTGVPEVLAHTFRNSQMADFQAKEQK
jgi:hypothetical protein